MQVRKERIHTLYPNQNNTIPTHLPSISFTSPWHLIFRPPPEDVGDVEMKPRSPDPECKPPDLETVFSLLAFPRSGGADIAVVLSSLEGAAMLDDSSGGFKFVSFSQICTMPFLVRGPLGQIGMFFTIQRNPPRKPPRKPPDPPPDPSWFGTSLLLFLLVLLTRSQVISRNLHRPEAVLYPYEAQFQALRDLFFCPPPLILSWIALSSHLMRGVYHFVVMDWYQRRVGDWYMATLIRFNMYSFYP